MSIIHSQHCSSLASSITFDGFLTLPASKSGRGWNLCVILEGVRKIQVKRSID
jgi:hypothetical protein